MKGIYLFFIFTLMRIALFAQPASQTALLKQIGKSRPDTSRVALLLKAGCFHLLKPGNRKQDLDSAFSFFNPALELSRSLRSDKWVNECLAWQGDCYLEGNRLAPGEECFQKVVDFYRQEGNKKGEADTWKRLGLCIPGIDAAHFIESCRIFELAKTAYLLARDTSEAIAMLKFMGECNLLANRLELAQNELLTVVQEYKSVHYPYLHFTYDLLRAVYKLKGETERELFYAIEMVKSVESSHDTAAAPDMYVMAAATCLRARMYDASLNYARTGIELIKKMDFNDQNVRGNYYRFTDLAVNALLVRDSAQVAFDWLKNAASFHPPESFRQRQIMYLGLGRCNMALRQYTAAEKQFRRLGLLLDSVSQKIVQAENFPNPEPAWTAYQAISSYYTMIGQYTVADRYLNKIPLHAREPVSVTTRMEYELIRSQVDSGLGDYNASLHHYKTYQQIKDSLYNSDRDKLIAELQIKYETSQKDKDLKLQAASIELLNKENKLRKNQVHDANLLRNTMTGGIILLVLLIAVIGNRYRLKKRNNLRLEKLLRENEWLMREIHHRVKNNLQVVMSLLNSQTGYMKDPIAISAVMEGRHRVQAMSLIHQKLYRSTEVSNVEMHEYVCELVDYLRHSFDVHHKVDLDVCVALITLDVSQAVPLGLILNEVITNSYKYAFNDTASGKITLKLTIDDHRKITVFIADNGRGLPTGIRVEANEHFGISLIHGLCEDLEANLQVHNVGGLGYTISFIALNPFETSKNAPAHLPKDL